MNWYKEAKNRLFIDVKQKENMSFFNYLKSTGYYVTLYHGTNQETLDKIRKTGYMFAPKLNKQDLKDSVNPNNMYSKQTEVDARYNRIYFTTKPSNARIYSATANEYPVVLKVEVPIFMIAEIQEMLLGDKVKINERKAEDAVEFMLEQDLPDDVKAKRLTNMVQRGILSGRVEDEFAVSGYLPAKHIVETYGEGLTAKRDRLDDVPQDTEERPGTLESMDNPRYFQMKHPAAPTFDAGNEEVDKMDFPTRRRASK